MNKRGQEIKWKYFIIAIVVIALILGVGILIDGGVFKNWFGDAEINTDTKPIGDVLGGSWNWLTYIFGGIPEWLIDYGVQDTSGLIITIAVFFLIFVTFGDIIQNFSSFSQPVSWISAGLLAIIAANLKLTVSVLSIAIGIFAPLGGLAVIAGLVAAFVVFFGVNWGVKGLGPLIMRRKAMLAAQKTEIETEVGAKEVSGAINGMKEIGESLKS